MGVEAVRVTCYEDRHPVEVSYWKEPDGYWLIFFPNKEDDNLSMLGNLRSHKVEEHEDGTISVSPSILVTGRWGERKLSIHGFLTRGVWTEA